MAIASSMGWDFADLARRYSAGGATATSRAAGAPLTPLRFALSQPQLFRIIALTHGAFRT